MKERSLLATVIGVPPVAQWCFAPFRARGIRHTGQNAEACDECGPPATRERTGCSGVGEKYELDIEGFDFRFGNDLSLETQFRMSGEKNHRSV